MLSLSGSFFIHPFPAWVLLLRADFRISSTICTVDFLSLLDSSHPIIIFHRFLGQVLLSLGLPFHFYLNTAQIVILKFFFIKCTWKVKSSSCLHVWKCHLNLKSNLDWNVIPAWIELVLRTLNYYLLSDSFPGKRATQSSSRFDAGHLFLL